MVILACLAFSIILAAMAWRKGWKKKALWPVLCLFIIAVIDAALSWALSDISVFGPVVGIVCIAWLNLALIMMCSCHLIRLSFK